MRKSSKEYYRSLAVNPRDHARGLCVTGAGYQPAAPGSVGVPERRHPPGHSYAWDAGRVLSESAVGFVTHDQGEFDSQATGPRSLEAGDALILFPGVRHRYRPLKDTGWGSYWIHFEGETAEMLRDSPMSVKHIAVTLGFRNPCRFSKLFKRKTGASPSDYRQHWRSVSARDAVTTC